MLGVSRRLFSAFLVVSLLLPLNPSVAAASDGLRIVPYPATPAVDRAAAPDRVLVRWRADATSASRASVIRAEGLRPVRPLGLPRLELLDTRGRSVEAVVAALSRRGVVEYAEPDFYRHFAANPTGEEWFGELWGLHNTGQTVGGVAGQRDADIDFPKAARTTLGKSSVVVAVVDDGVDLSHPDLAGRAWRNPGETGNGKATNGKDDDGNGLVDDVNGWDFFHDDRTVHDFEDDAHGTHVAGTIAATLNGIGVVGVAPRVKIMALKFGNASGGLTSDAIRAIRYAAAKGADVINASWGGPSSSALRDAIAGSGILMVAAAGNEALNNDTSAGRPYPASYGLANIIAVGAADSRGQLASFSNYGPSSVDLVAPGVNILSIIPATSEHGPAGAFASGTSMAAPHVTGVAALVVSVKPGLASRPSDLRKRLIRTVKAAPATAGLTVSGGMVNALRAVDFVAPTVSRPKVDLAKGERATGDGAIPVRVSWTAGDATSGLDRVQLQQRRDGGSWRPVSLPAATASSRIRNLLPGHAYEFRVRAWDRAGNRSAFATSNVTRVVVRQDGSSLVHRSGSWSRVTKPSALGGALRASDEAGASAATTFTGRAVAWIAERGPGYGKARVFIDGVKVAVIDLEASATQPRRLLFARTWGSSVQRTIEIRVVGTAGRPRVTLDAFAFLR
ncbi:MAG TPA: S8 family serine peptidase [Candidatus Limnocylindria bacterium]